MKPGSGRVETGSKAWENGLGVQCPSLGVVWGSVPQPGGGLGLCAPAWGWSGALGCSAPAWVWSGALGCSAPAWGWFGALCLSLGWSGALCPSLGVVWGSGVLGSYSTNTAWQTNKDRYKHITFSGSAVSHQPMNSPLLGESRTGQTHSVGHWLH